MKILEAPYGLNYTPVPAPHSEPSGEGFWYWTHLDTLQQSELHFNAPTKPSPLTPQVVEPPLSLRTPFAKPVEPPAGISQSAASSEPEVSLPVRPAERPEHLAIARLPVQAKRTPEPTFTPDEPKTRTLTKTTPLWQATPLGVLAQPATCPSAGMHVFTEGKTAEIALKSPHCTGKTRQHLAQRLRKALRAIGFNTRHLLINGEPL